MTDIQISDTSFTQEQLSALLFCARDLNFNIGALQRETSPQLRDFYTARVRDTIRSVLETAANIDPDRQALEDLHGVRYERVAFDPCGTMLFPVTHIFPAGHTWVWGFVSITPKTSSEMPALSWALLEGTGRVLARGKEYQTACGSRQQMIRQGLDVLHRHGGRRVWPRNRVTNTCEDE